MIIALSAQALFDMTSESEFFREFGQEAYDERQAKLVDVPFKPGLALPLARKFYALNEVLGNYTDEEGNPFVEITVFSHMSPHVGLRVTKSLDYYGIKTSMNIFSGGLPLSDYLEAYNVNLYLSSDEEEVKNALKKGIPAGVIESNSVMHDEPEDDKMIRLAFDFDGVLADDSSERICQEQGVFAFNQHEIINSDVVMGRGPLTNFLVALSEVQQKIVNKDDKRLHISLMTARGEGSVTRVINTLKAYNIRLDAAFFLCGHNKTLALANLKPHLFFDDQLKHINKTKDTIPSVHIPYGIMND